MCELRPHTHLFPILRQWEVGPLPSSGLETAVLSSMHLCKFGELPELRVCLHGGYRSIFWPTGYSHLILPSMQRKTEVLLVQSFGGDGAGDTGLMGLVEVLAPFIVHQGRLHVW